MDAKSSQPKKPKPLTAHKCLICKRRIKEDQLLIAIYDPETRYVFYFCKYWHLFKWKIQTILKKVL